MKTLDRFIIRLYLINFGILLAVFTVLFTVIDLIVDLDEFLEAGRERAAEFGGVLPATLWTIGDYYGPVTVLLYVFFSGLIAVAAMGFTFAGLSRNGELVAMVTSGLSMYRIAAPVVLVGCLLNLLTLPSQELLIPSMAEKLARPKSQVGMETIGGFQIQYARDQNRNLLSAANFETGSDHPMLNGVTILVRNQAGKALRRITADQAFWDEARGGWDLVGGLAISPTDPTPSFDAATGREAEPIEFFPTNLSPTVLLADRAKIYPMLLSIAHLRELAANSSIDPAPIQKIMHSRLSTLVLNVLVLVIGLPFFLTREPVNMLRQGIKAAGACLGAWGFGLLSLHVGLPMLNPIASSWLPVVLFLPLAAWLLQLVKT